MGERSQGAGMVFEFERQAMKGDQVQQNRLTT